MTPFQTTLSAPLPLARCRADRGLPVPEVEPVPAFRLPADARALLDHQGGMTAALEAYWGEPMGLRLIHAAHAPKLIRRQVLLSGTLRQRPAELGLIEIHLHALPAQVRDGVLAADMPFGTLLTRAGLSFRSTPSAFLRLAADADLADWLDVTPGHILYGRHTHLTDRHGGTLAEAVEILSGHAPDGRTVPLS